MKQVLMIIAFLCSYLSVDAQLLTSEIDAKLYKARVKLIDEFFDRFNGTEGRPDIKETDSLYQRKNLLVLFDGALFKANKEKTLGEVKELIDTIVASKTKINYSDTTWFAKAVCHGHFKGKDVDFALYLTMENRRKDMYKWVIAKAEGELFKLTPSKKTDNIMLMPDDHETNFMSLHRITTEKDDYITNYSKKNFTLDETSVFFAYVYSGQLDIDNVNELEFTLLQVPGYVLNVKDIFRETFNSGWLISSYKKISDQEKQNIIDNLR